MLINDKATVDRLQEEYNFLLEEKFRLLDVISIRIEQRKSIVSIVTQVADITGRMRFIDERIYTILCIPTEFESPVIRTTKKARRYGMILLLVSYLSGTINYLNQKMKIQNLQKVKYKSVPVSQLFINQHFI